jgi:predicted ribosome quality control (RQC) complex YloA/Tae2 family protein
LTFGSGEAEHHIICEFYAGGNIVLTDGNYKIIALLRTYKSEDGSMNVAIGETYPTKPQQLLQLPTSEQLSEAVKSANANTVLRDIMAKQFVIGTEMIDHCLASCGIDARLKAPQYLEEWTPKLIEAFQKTLSFAESPESHKGYVIFNTAEDRAIAEKAKPSAKKKGGKKDNKKDTTPEPESPAPSAASTSTATATSEIVSPASVAERTDIFYENFVPFQFDQHKGLRFIEFPDFDAAVDEYYSKIEAQKVEAQRLEQEGSLVKRLDKVREDNEKRVQTLVDAEERARMIANLIEKNSELVDAVIKTINGYLARQIDWMQLADLVKQEKKKGDPLASVIHKLKLESNQVVVLLYPPEDEEDYEEEEEDSEDEDDEENGEPKVAKPDASQVKAATAVEIDLSLSAHKNSTKYFTATKKASDKKQKTLDAAKVAMKRAERKVRSDLKEVKLKASIQKLRSPYWFEKFNWFITSEGFIVVSGRDMHQNEMLYKRYLAKGDAYIHADVHGASTCIVKNPTGAPIPPRTLTEAGALSVCHSAAWKNKVLTSAWWVEESQVSKTAPTGEYLSTGSFMIRGKKNFLPPSGLVMGFGILFRLADESIASHVKENSEDDVRKEKERKNLERDAQDQAKYGEDIQEATERSAATEENLVDLGGDDDSEGEDFPEENQHEATERETTQEAGEDEDSEEDDNEHTDEATDSKFAINLAAQGDVDEDEAALLAEEDATASALSGVSIAPTESSESDAASSTSGTTTGEKKKLTKHERARLKKAEARGVDHIEKGPKPVKKATATETHTTAKKKKIPKKYRHQDEEERRLAMEILGSAGKSKNAPTTEAKATGKPSGNQKVTASSSTGPAGGDKSSIAAKNAARQQAAAAQLAKDKEEEEIRRLMKDEKLDQLSEADLEKMREMSAKGLGVNLSALTGRPRGDDVLLYAMAVCAPYDALGDYKYKIKITPGNFKKGKSAKLAITAFLHQAEATDREKELIRSIPDTELAMVMISNAKLQMAGLSSVVKKM